MLLRSTTLTITTTTQSILSLPKLISHFSHKLPFSTSPSPSLTLPKATFLSFPSYGPSLHKGTPIQNPRPTPEPENDETDSDPDPDFSPYDKSQFTRTYAVAALRVPADLCSDLERRIRGHLLNWPRIRNVARVPGDEVDEEVRELVVRDKEGEDETERERAVERRVFGRAEGDGERLSGVLLRERLAKDFNARGFIRFKNLARISRPNDRGKKKRKKREGNDGSESEGEGEKRWVRDRKVMVEVVEEEEGEGESGGGEEGGDLSGLLGEGYRDKKWRGSTRLLLLDERYVGRSVEELPEAIKVRV